MAALPLQPSTTGSRSRPQARKKPNDDASYFGPPLPGSGAAGTKRQAAEKVEGEPRGKRKRTEQAQRHDVVENEPRASLVEFVKMPTSVLYRYLTQFDIIPPVWPPPLSAEDPPQPSFLENPFRQPSRAPTPLPMTPANRPRRESKDQGRRRSSRLIEEETRSRPPILADIEELHVVLAGIAERHFRDVLAIGGREEVDTLASFMCAVERAKGGRIKC